ncbi:MAG TPA: DNA primase [Dehalococcoidia bacterium]|nr:DNA primase [Dehalococcoidia bacterium]
MNDAEEVKSRLDIVEVVGQYLSLQKAGRTFKAPCPFHAEKTPSFIVSPDRQSWHCFGACGTGGDVISFVMRREGIEFPEALKMLAERAGVRLKERRPASPEQEKARERLYAANEAAAAWFTKLLNDGAGRSAKAYVEKRGIDEATAQAFALGYAPDEWQAAEEYLTGLGFSQRELLSAGLLVSGERGSHDRFRGRLMFPVWDTRGRIVGFGARAMSDAATPKYLNTAQTPLFDKGGILYAYDRAKDAIQQEGCAVVVEGYMDVIAAHQYGFRNVVAQMGTALTERQVRLLKRVSAEIVLGLDADQAGTQAMIRGHDVVMEAQGAGEPAVPVVNWRGLVTYQESASVELKVAVLPEGKDPDDFIREDADAWRTLIDSAKPVLDYRLDAAAQAHDLANPRGRSDLAREFLPLLSAVADPVVRAHYLQRLSRLAQVSEEELARMLGRPQRRLRGGLDGNQPAQRSSIRANSTEEFVLALLLQHPALREHGLAAPEDVFWDAQAAQLFKLWKDLETEIRVKEEAPPELEEYLARLYNRRLPVSDVREAAEALEDCIRKLNDRRLRAEKEATATQIADLQDEVGVSAILGSVQQEILVRDTEIGRELHKNRREDSQERVETRVNGN